MAILNGGQLKDILIKNLFNSKDSDDDALVTKTILRDSYVYNKVADDAAANTNTSETPFGAEVLVPSILSSVKWTASANVATDATDTVTITIKKRSSAGAATTICSYVTSTAILQEFVPKSFTLPANSDVYLAAGDSLTFSATKAGAGKVLTAGKLVAVVEKARYV